VHLDYIKVFFYSPTDAQVNCLKNSLLPNSATYTHQQGPTNICSHITTELTTHRCILTG